MYVVESTDWIKETRDSTVRFCQQGDEPSASIRHTKFQSLNDYWLLKDKRFMDSVNTSVLLQVAISCTEIK
jgi:hypothetical protein